MKKSLLKSHYKLSLVHTTDILRCAFTFIWGTAFTWSCVEALFLEFLSSRPWISDNLIKGSFVFSVSSTWHFFSFYLLEIPICLCLLSTFSIRSFNLLTVGICKFHSWTIFESDFVFCFISWQWDYLFSVATALFMP